MEVVRTLELEEDFLHKSSLSRLFALLSARDQNEEWSREKNKERKSDVKEKGQNTSGSGFAATEIPIWKKKVFADRTPISFEIKKNTERHKIAM